MTLYNDLLRHTRALFYGVLPYPESLDVLPESGHGRWEKSTGQTGRMVAAQPEDSPTFAETAEKTALDIVGSALKDVAKGQVKEAAKQICELGKDLGPVTLDTAAYAFFKNMMQGG